jgi:hypothetical protein
MYAGAEQLTAIRFSSVAVPPNATITSATITFDIDEIHSGQSDAPVTVSIFGEAGTNAAPFSETISDVSARPSTTSAVIWNPSTPGEDVNGAIFGGELQTSDISIVVQEVTSLDGWVSGGPLTIIFGHISGSGSRWVAAPGPPPPCATEDILLEWSEGVAATGHAQFGAAAISVLAHTDLDIVLAEPIDGCGDAGIAGDNIGKIVMMERGACPFVEKAINAQNSGAIAALIYNNRGGDTIMMSGNFAHAMSGDSDGHIIPTISMSQNEGVALATAVAAETTTVSLHCGKDSYNSAPLTFVGLMLWCWYVC